ncbi:MAG: 4Fe-4S dicluster domain-containing protein [Desulforhopalus sp.]
MAKQDDALDIINNPANFSDRSEDLDENDLEKSHATARTVKEGEEPVNMSRRTFLKVGSAAAAAATMAGAGAAGLAIGRSDDGYTGYGRTYQGGDMFFNRKPFRVEQGAFMKPVAKVERPERMDFLFDRLHDIVGLIKSNQWNPEMGLEKLPGEVGDHYRKNPDQFPVMMSSLKANMDRAKDWQEGTHKRYTIADAYNKAYLEAGMSNSHGTTCPEDPDDVFKATGKPIPPEEWDFRHVKREEPLQFKSPKHASKLIKRMAHMFGMSVVGITKFDPSFMFKNKMRGMPHGGAEWGDKVPGHWKSIIVFGVPMYWDQTYAAIGYSTSFDAYYRSQTAAGMLERFIHEIGYPARAQFPGYHYEIMLAPYVIKAGLGEYSRAGVVMVPELGANFRPAAVVTNIDFEYDKPISVKMADFCMKCKLCADACPSGAIPKTDKPETTIRGFKRWRLDEEKCFKQWASGPTGDGLGCRVCIGVCPYSRKNSWIHTISRELEPRDPTGLVAEGLLAMQKNFFKYPEAEDFKAKWDGGKETNYHNPPWWMRSEDFFKIEKTWEYHGMN